MSFAPAQVGQHQVSVTFRGKPLLGSPFTFDAIDRPIYHRDYKAVGDQPVRRFGSQGVGDGQFYNPYSVTCNSRGEIVVADYLSHRIQVFDRNGKFLFKVGHLEMELLSSLDLVV